MATIWGDIATQDLVLYVSYWPKGGQVNLTHEFQTPNNGGAKRINTDQEKRDVLVDDTNPTAFKSYQGVIKADNRNQFAENWTDYWYNDGWRGGSSDAHEFEEPRAVRPRTFPILSFYDRIPVSRNSSRDKLQYGHDRVDFLRHGLRHMDLSAAISAGKMAIIAVSTSDTEPLPFPIEVQGDPIQGKGVVYYQFVIPVDRSAVVKVPAPATTQPATQPTTQKGKAGG